MRKIEDYRKHAQECRALARNMAPGEHRDQLLNMAQTWELLAQEREHELAKAARGSSQERSDARAPQASPERQA